MRTLASGFDRAGAEQNANAAMKEIHVNTPFLPAMKTRAMVLGQGQWDSADHLRSADVSLENKLLIDKIQNTDGCTREEARMQIKAFEKAFAEPVAQQQRARIPLGAVKSHPLSEVAMKSIFDPSFRYTPSFDTNLKRTFARIRRDRKVEAESAERAARPTLAEVSSIVRNVAAAK